MLILALGVAALVYRHLQMYAPSNAIVARIRQKRPRFRVAAGLMGLSATLAAGAFVLADRVVSGAPGWLNIVVFIAIWDACKFAALGVAVFVRWAGGALLSAHPLRQARTNLKIASLQMNYPAKH
jgi:hypothetical protein